LEGGWGVGGQILSVLSDVWELGEEGRGWGDGESRFEARAEGEKGWLNQGKEQRGPIHATLCLNTSLAVLHVTLAVLILPIEIESTHLSKAFARLERWFSSPNAVQMSQPTKTLSPC
jgi:hypothetical protein